jgi:hypothetical protein
MNEQLLTMLAAGLATLSACSSSDPQPPGGATPSFERDIAPVLEARCSHSRGCHGADPTPLVDLDLRSARAYRELVAVPAETGRVALFRVEPGHPAASLLVQKLTGRSGPGSGKAMPLDPTTGEPLTPSPLPPGWIEDVLVVWIERGSPEN